VSANEEHVVQLTGPEVGTVIGWAADLLLQYDLDTDEMALIETLLLVAPPNEQAAFANKVGAEIAEKFQIFARQHQPQANPAELADTEGLDPKDPFPDAPDAAIPDKDVTEGFWDLPEAPGGKGVVERTPGP
jgi:hypothetical protein